jgi:magnesium transporter
MSDNEKRNETSEETMRLRKEDIENALRNGQGENPTVNEPVLPSRVHAALSAGDQKATVALLAENSEVMLADALNQLTDPEVVQFFTLTSDYAKLGEIFSYISVEEREALCKGLPKKNLALVLTGVPNDDLADFVEDLTKTMRGNVMALLPAKRRQIIESLAKYSDDTIGSIMTTEYLAVAPTMIIKDVFSRIKEVGEKLETVRTIFVTDNNKILGTERLEDMMFQDPELPISQVMVKDYPYISPIADKEEAILICQKYDLPVLPVVSKNGDLLGIITFDDVMDVIEEENTEDVLKRAGVTPTEKPYLETKAFRMARSYVIWLIILLILNTFTAMLVSNFETALLAWPILLSFTPALSDSCGDAGDQTTSVVTRALATGDITTHDFLKVAMKELAAGFLTAVLVAVFNFAWVLLELNTPILNVTETMKDTLVNHFGNLEVGYCVISAIVSGSFLIGITLAKFFAALLPMLANVCHIDPAVMSGPLIASLMDILTLTIYFTIATLVLRAVDPGSFSDVTAVINASQSVRSLL